MKSRQILYNIFWGFGTQIIILAVGLVVPRLILLYYGSDINGLLNTVTQIFAYMSLLECGIGTATVQGLYGPIAQKDRQGISAIYAASGDYYRGLSKYYLLCIAAAALIGPCVIKTDIARSVIGIIILFEGLAGYLSFRMTGTFKQLLTAEGKYYIVNIFTFTAQVLVYLMKIILAVCGIPVIFIAISHFLIVVIQVSLYRGYLRRNYGWLDRKAEPNKEPLRQQGYFLVHQLSYVIFNNTDSIVLSISCGLATASVYAVYNMVFTALMNLFAVLFDSVKFLLGQTYHEDIKEYQRIHDSFESIYLAVVFAMIGTGYLLILPFVRLYTSGVNDADYIDGILPVLFCLIQLMSASRAVGSNLINIAQHARQTLSRTIAEAVINLVVSIIAVRFLGIYGVLIGTIVALLYRTNDIILYANHRLLHRKAYRTYVTVVFNFVLFGLLVLFTRGISFNIGGYLSFFAHGAVIAVILLIICLVGNILINPASLSVIREVFLSRRGRD